MGGPTAHKSTEQGITHTSNSYIIHAYSIMLGADTALYLAMLPPATNEPNGLFLRDRTPKTWKS